MKTMIEINEPDVARVLDRCSKPDCGARAQFHVTDYGDIETIQVRCSKCINASETIGSREHAIEDWNNGNK